MFVAPDQQVQCGACGSVSTAAKMVDCDLCPGAWFCSGQCNDMHESAHGVMAMKDPNAETVSVDKMTEEDKKRLGVKPKIVTVNK